MEAFETRWSVIQSRLEQRIKDVDLFEKYLKNEYKNIKKFLSTRISKQIKDFLQNLIFLAGIFPYYSSKKCFGVEVFLSELDDLFTKWIYPLKISLDLLLSSQGSNDSNIAELVSSLGAQIENSSFIKIASSRKVSTATKPLSAGITQKKPFSDDTFNILDEYLGVGGVLKDDQATKSFIGQIKHLHTEADIIAMYSAIIGPSFMGKTQTAFTLSCLINVIYINFLPTLRKNLIKKPQKIYTLFYGVAELFKKVLQRDEFKLKKVNLDKTAESIEFSKLSFQTLGLIYLILRTRKIREDECTKIAQPFSVKDWFIEIINIDLAIVPSMTAKKFFEKTEDIDFTKLSVFIDELPRNNDDVSTAVMFLRNLCRVVRIPTFVSGTDSHVGNMIGRPGSAFGSRLEANQTKPWVNINVKTSKASLISFSKLVKFKKHDEEKPSGCLSTYILNSSNELDYAGLLGDVYGSAFSSCKLNSFKKLAKFLILQAETSLPGIISLIFIRLLKLLPKHSDGKELWKQLVEGLTLDISARKIGLMDKDGLFASSHILTFPSVDETVVEVGRYSANLVENHLFYYGTRDDTTFQLDLQYDTNNIMTRGQSELKILLTRNGSKYIDKCNFPELNEDFFTTFACLNMWNIGVIKNDKAGENRLTMASLYKDYVKQIHNFNLGVAKTVQNSFSLELLSYWSICRASHQNVNGETDGVDVFWEFVKNLQKSEDSYGNIQAIKFIDSEPLNPKLKNLLEKIKVPYLMRFPAGLSKQSTRASLKEYIGDFIEIGESSFPRDKFGWDVTFDMKCDGVSKTGLIECKFVAEAIGYAVFFDYYKKQCESSEYPLAFLVCRKLAKEISVCNAEIILEAKFAKFSETLIEKSTDKSGPKTEGNNVSKSRSNKRTKIKLSIEEKEAVNHVNKAIRKEGDNSNEKKVKNDYIARLNEMWTDSNNHIDIYTVKHNQFIGNNQITGNFTVSPLKTFPNPKGAFILVEANFNASAATVKH